MFDIIGKQQMGLCFSDWKRRVIFGLDSVTDP